MSRNPFAAVAISPSVVSEFAARSDASKLLKWSATRVPWIHMMSMASTCGGNFSPLGSTSGNFALYGGAPNSSMYNPSTLLPWPIITGMDISALGSLGTTRKAVVKFKCFTDEDLVELQKCYFIPGMDVRVQWGWSVSCNGTTPSLYTSVADRATAVCELRNRASAAQDGFQGIVANFKYNLMPDNSWDCEIEVISPAEPFSQSNVSNADCGCARKNEIEDQEGETKEVVQKNGEMYAFFLDSFKDSDAMDEWLSKLRSKAPSTLIPHINGTSRNYLGKARTEAGGDDSSFYEGTFFNDYDTTEQFISWGAVEAAINVLALPEDPNFSYGRIDSSGIEFDHPSYSLAMCADPRIGYMPGGNQFHAGQCESGCGIPDAFSGGKVTLCNMMLNVLWLKLELKKVLDGDKSMMTFVTNVLNELNRQCGGAWDIQIVSDSETESGCGPGKAGGQGGLISVIDNKKFIEGAQTWQVPSTNTTSAIRNMNLDLKMTSAMKTQALYSNGTQQNGGGNQSKDGDPNACEGVAFKSFGLGVNIKNKAMPSAQTGASKPCKCDEISSVDKADPPTLSGLQGECKDYVCDETVNALRNQLTGEIAALGKSGVPEHCQGVALPFDFGFECDGIGGFKFGQFITSDRIPPEIRGGWDFQIMKVEHSVTANDWTTKVNTIARNSGK